MERIKKGCAVLLETKRFLPRARSAKPWNTPRASCQVWKCIWKTAGSKSTTTRSKNAIRPTALGKKNWLFIGEADAGDRGAILYTIIESCRRRGVEPFAYLKDVLTRLPQMTNKQVPELLPAVWGKPAGESLRKAS